MDHLYTGNADIVLPRLAFGCGSLMASLGREESLSLLNTAFDAGITHFDVARSYGYGEAESVLGLLIAGRRDQFTVATKFGIAPPPIGTSPVLKAVARRVANILPGLRPLLRRTASGMVSSTQFTRPLALKSVETSLRQLKTDYVDFLLMHEPDLHVVENDEMCRFLEDCIVKGVARHVGVASSAFLAENISEMSRPPLSVLQHPWSILDGAASVSHKVQPRFHVVHSVIGPVLNWIEQNCSANSSLRERAAAVGFDVNNTQLMVEVTLASSIELHRTGTVIYSSRSAKRIASTLKSVNDNRQGHEVQRFINLINSSKRLR